MGATATNNESYNNINNRITAFERIAALATIVMYINDKTTYILFITNN